MTREDTMTSQISREDMLDKLKGIIFGNPYGLGFEDREAINMAIDALEQEPCEDYISREELLNAMDAWDKFGCDIDLTLKPLRNKTDILSPVPLVSYVKYDDMIKCVKGIPSVQPKSRWIPCSERLPMPGHNILLCTNKGIVGEGEFKKDYWFMYRWNSTFQTDEVTAWMPLPEAYKAKE